MQPNFVAEIFRRCHELDLHTALDTSGYAPLGVAKPVLAHTDLVLLDIKSYLPELYRKVPAFRCSPLSIWLAIWIRFTSPPGFVLCWFPG
jgi:Pyruvate-formate lyase-activating enzyme